ncbi:MAG: acetate/propionate family kinase [Verrucomicrobiales bacterium]|jgi:acetate kinase|nr:acetate/propionate family kinase [Verrucomicrobiales bacterium]
MQTDLILVANIGSTSFKFRLFEMPSERVLARGGVERIGADGGLSPYKIQVADGEPVTGSGAFGDYAAAFAFVEKTLTDSGAPEFSKFAAFGFKPVMAKNISDTRVMDSGVLAAMEEINTLLPAHNPPYVAAIRAFQKLHPRVPCIGTFETAFYDRVPPENRRYPVPLAWEKDYGVRRYGFHGASHRYVTLRMSELLGGDRQRVISCHLGGSSSIACIKDGWAIDSSWGMTPQSGLPQNNRVGDFDAFALLWLLRDQGVTVGEAEKILGTQSGLKGMSGLASGDVRDIYRAIADGDDNARVAMDVFVAAIRRYVGQFLLELNGADALVFTAGIGENNPDLRAAVCHNLDYCGLRLDAAKNATVSGGVEVKISAPDSTVSVWVIPTNEELIIARNAWEKLNHE